VRPQQNKDKKHIAEEQKEQLTHLVFDLKLESSCIQLIAVVFVIGMVVKIADSQT